MTNTRILAAALLLIGVLVGYFVYHSEVASTSNFFRPFKLGLDLKGGSHLVYQADTSKLPEGEVDEAMTSLREVIERRVNVFGVGEPLIQVENAGSIQRLIVELPGVTDLKQAVALINATPQLEFKLVRPEGPEKEAILAAYKRAQEAVAAGQAVPNDPLLAEDPYYLPSGLTGRYLSRATVEFGGQTLGPSVNLEFNNEGKELFAEMTKNNIGKPIAIYLDNQVISEPVVQQEIRDGKAQISGNFSLEDAKTLVRNLNLGALPVPISLVSTETIGPTLGAEALSKGVRAGLFGLLVVALFMIVWYRLPGLVSVISLLFYVAILLAIFKLIPVTLTAAGIAGFILSVGMALDANILIFERMKEEMWAGKSIREAIGEGFSRAWFSIRDSNLTSLIAAITLFWFGTSIVKGFALTLIIGILVSMFTAITLTRTFLLAFSPERQSKFTKFFFSGGMGSKSKAVTK